MIGFVVRSADADIRAIVEQVKNRSEAKERMHGMLQQGRTHLGRNAGRPPTTPCQAPSCGLSSQDVEEIIRAVPRALARIESPARGA